MKDKGEGKSHLRLFGQNEAKWFSSFFVEHQRELHKSFFFPLLHLQFNWNNFIQLFTEHPHIHMCTTHRHFSSLSLPGPISFSPSLFLSVSLSLCLSARLSPAPVWMHSNIFSYMWTYSQTLCHLPPFSFLCLGAIRKELCTFLLPLFWKLVSLLPFPFLSFFFFLVFSSLPILPSWQTRCDCASHVVMVYRTSKWWEADIFRIAAMASGIYPGRFYKWKFSKGGNWSNLNQIKIILSAGRVLNYRGDVMGVGGDQVWDRNHGDLSQV